MVDGDLGGHIGRLEADNARLRRLLERPGAASVGLRHQVRNTLALLREIVRRSAEFGGDVETYAAHLDGRLDAVLRVQNAVANGPGEGEVSLHALVADELLAQAIGDERRSSVLGPDVVLQPVAASAFALVLHELATNAVKFGAVTAPGGTVDVGWTVEPGEGEPWLAWCWVESGLSRLPPEPPRRGFGIEMIERSLSYQVGAETELRFTPTGLRCAIRLPLMPWIGAVRPAEGPAGSSRPDAAR